MSRGFAPIARADATILVLGSLPSVRSLQQAEYYAHPQNAFWRIMSTLTGASGDYERRCAVLQDNGIAVWDVLASSVRPGSLDADIDMNSAEINDFSAFFGRHQHIKRICFNGQTAAKIFARRVSSADMNPDSKIVTLPSTSPAHATMSFDAKLARWRDGLNL